MVGASKRANMNPLEAVEVELPLKRCELAVPKITRKDIIAEGTCVEYAKTLAYIDIADGSSVVRRNDVKSYGVHSVR